MKQRFWEWLRTGFLPEWARRQLCEENRELRRQLEASHQDVQRLEAYIQGMQTALRAFKRAGGKGGEER